MFWNCGGVTLAAAQGLGGACVATGAPGRGAFGAGRCEDTVALVPDG